MKKTKAESEEEDQSVKDRRAQDKIKAEKMERAEKVRNEGIETAKNKETNEEVDLEIEAPGSAASVAEEGALTVQDDTEFKTLTAQLTKARAKPENKLGKGGQLIELQSPKVYENTIKIMVLHDSKTDEKSIKSEKFETKNPTQAKTAAMAMQMTLETNLGALIVDDGQQGRESLIQNMASDQSKQASQIASGYAIRNGLTQKMAPGDKMFHLVSLKNNKTQMVSIKSRKEANIEFAVLGKVPKIMMAGETGDIL